MWGQLFQGCPFLERERAGMGTLTLEWEGQSMGTSVVLDTDIWWGKLWVVVRFRRRSLGDGILWGEASR